MKFVYGIYKSISTIWIKNIIYRIKFINISIKIYFFNSNLKFIILIINLNLLFYQNISK